MVQGRIVFGQHNKNITAVIKYLHVFTHKFCFSIGESVAAVIVTARSQLPVWEVWPLSKRKPSNDSIVQVAATLHEGVKLALDENTVKVTRALLDNMVEQAETRGYCY